MPSADHPHRARDVGRRPVLGDEARTRPRPARRSPRSARRRRSAARCVGGERARSRSQISGARLLAEEQVDERDVGLVAARQRERLLAGARAQRSARPTAARRASAGSPSARRRGRRRSGRAARRSAPPWSAAGLTSAGSTGTTRRTRQRPGSRAPNSTRPPACSASKPASRRPMPVCPRPRRRTPSLVDLERRTCRRHASSGPRRASGSACLCALRTASASTDCASGSSSARHLDALGPSASETPRSGCSRRSRSSSSRSVVRSAGASGRAGAAAPCAGRPARPASPRRSARAPRRRARLPETARARRRTAAGRRPRGRRARGRCAPRAARARSPAGASRARASAASAAVLPSVHSSVALGVASAARRRRRGRTRITPSQRPAADIGAQTSVASRSRPRYSSGTSGRRRRAPR